MTNSALTKTEELLLCNFEDNFDVSNEISCIKLLWSGDWVPLIVNDSVRNILNYNKIDVDKSEEIFCAGIASLFCFIQSNFTGPDLSENLVEFLSEFNNKNLLVVDSEEIDVNTKHPELLIIALTIFENSSLKNSNLVTWWHLRSIIIHQNLLDVPSETLYSKLKHKISDLSEWDLNSRLKAKLHLELFNFYLLYGQVNESEKNLNSAKQLLRMSYDLGGELGKRTKFQQKDIAQILLRVTLNEGVQRPTFTINNIPEVVKLDDEVRLDQIEYCAEYDAPELPITEQAIIFSEVQYMQKARPKDELLLEESEAFLIALLQQNNNWAIRFNVLLLRCLLESRHKRTIERSLTQCESLISHLNQGIPDVINRLGAFWGTGMLPKWKIEGHLANMTLNLGLVKAALELYLKLQMWEEVIVCYTIMELKHKAAEIIETQLKLNPTVKLWCLLGDATNNINCYEKAWELSQEKSCRAQRHWGQYLFARKEYSQSIPHLQKSLEINSLQNMVWLRLGYAALEIEDWKLAATAYRRYTYLEPGGFEAWNNLAKAYIKLGEKTRAHFALQEALKYSFDNWKIWDNFMVVSAAIGQLSDVIRSYHQILDLKEKHLDTEVLYILTKQLLNEDKPGILNKTRELFGRLTSIYQNESKLWEMYADLSPNADLKAQRLYRAYRGLVQDDWSKNPDKCGRVLEICQRLGETTLEAGNVSTTSSARLTLKSAIAAARKQSWEQHEHKLGQLEKLLEKITN